MPTKRETTACFTGYRPKDMFGYQITPYKIMRQYLKDIALYFYREKNTKNFLTGGAQGVDQLAFWAIYDAKKEAPDIKNILYLPCKEQDGTWAETGPFSKEEYKKMLQVADEIVYVSNEPYRFPKQMLDRDETIVRQSDYVIGVLQKGEAFQSMRHSGTAATMRYAKATGKILYKISYERNKVEFTDFTAKKISGQENIFFNVKNTIQTGYFAKLDEYKAHHLHPVSIARVTPKHIICDKLGILAPPQELLSDFKSESSLSDQEYEERYLSHLNAIDLEKTFSSLPDLKDGETGYVLLCYETPEDFCHRHILADYLNRKYMLNIKEWEPTKEAELTEEDYQNEP